MENTTKPKLLYVITQAEWGGAQKYIFDLATSEEAQNYDITVAIGNTINTTLIDKLADKGIKIHSLKKLIRSINPLKDLSAISELKNLFSTLQPNIIHLNSSKAGIIGSFAYRLWNNINCRLIYTAHGWVFNEPLPNWKKTFYLNLEKNTAKDKNHIICVAQSDQKIATEKGIFPRQNLTTIHNGIDIAEMKLLEKFEARRLLELQPNAYIIGTIANFYPTKGLKYLIEAMYYLDNNYNLPIYLALIGDGQQKEELLNLIGNYNLKSRIFILGTKENAAQYLKGFDAYICSSVKEGMPYSIIEAMMAELPIISTNVGGIPEMLEQNISGILIDPQKPILLAENIKALYEHQEIADILATNAKNIAQQKFTKQQMIEQTFALYK